MKLRIPYFNDEARLERKIQKYFRDEEKDIAKREPVEIQVEGQLIRNDGTWTVVREGLTQYTYNDISNKDYEPPRV
jgi:hypothetical protein